MIPNYIKTYTYCNRRIDLTNLSNFQAISAGSLKLVAHIGIGVQPKENSKIYKIFKYRAILYNTAYRMEAGVSLNNMPKKAENTPSGKHARSDHLCRDIRLHYKLVRHIEKINVLSGF